jgi:hypothetical protein
MGARIQMAHQGVQLTGLEHVKFPWAETAEVRGPVVLSRNRSSSALQIFGPKRDHGRAIAAAHCG